MKQKIVLAITLISILLTGCNSKEESTYSHDGRVALENHQYEDAMKLLSSALEEDSADEHSRAMYMQARRMLNAIEYEEMKNYEKAIKELEFIEGIKSGSSTIKSEATSKKKELEKLYDEQLKAEQQRKEDAKNVANQDKYKLEQEALELEKQKQEALEKEKAEQEKEKEEQNKEDKKEENDKTTENQNDKEDKKEERLIDKLTDKKQNLTDKKQSTNKKD